MTGKTEINVGKRVLNQPNHWQDINLEEYKVERPVVLILGGNGTVSDKAANGNAKVVSSWLGVFKDDVDILSVNYNRVLHDKDNILQMQEYLTNQFFLPLVSKNGKKIDFQKACKNLRQVTLFAHCYGKIAFDHVFDMLAEKCKALGYEKSQIEQLLDQIFFVSYGIWSRESRVPCLNVLSYYDEMWLHTDMAWSFLLEQLDNVEVSPEDKKAIVETCKKAVDPLFEIEKFMTKNNRCFVLRDKNILRLASSEFHIHSVGDHTLKDLTRDENWETSTSLSKAGDHVSKCIACALCNSVANSILNQRSKKLIPFSLSELQKQLESVVKPLNEDKTK